MGFPPSSSPYGATSYPPHHAARNPGFTSLRIFHPTGLRRVATIYRPAGLNCRRAMQAHIGEMSLFFCIDDVLRRLYDWNKSNAHSKFVHRKYLKGEGMKTAHRLMIAVGITSTIMAGFGFWFNLTSLFTDFSHRIQDQEFAYFSPAFYIMSAICILCYVALFLCGVQFIRLRTGLVKLFVGLIVFEVIYFFSIGFMWLTPEIGRSIAAATGVANGGMSFQIFTLFPFWAPFLILWADGKLKSKENAIRSNIQEVENSDSQAN